MRKGIRQFSAFGFAIFICAMCFSCAAKPILRIEYQLPPVSDTLSGIITAVEVEDQREDQALLDQDAKHELRNFSNDISFSVSPGDEVMSIGVFDLSSIVKTTLEKRLENMGATIVLSPGPEDPVVKIILQHLQLTYAERTWAARVQYEAQLLKDNKILAREIMDGSGERMKIIGRTEADRVMTDTYTDTINQLHIEDLFRRGGVLP
jgi:hypothetical protein